MTSADPQHRELSPTLTSAWYQQTTTGTGGGCAILTKASLPLDAQTEAGAPAEVPTIHTAQIYIHAHSIYIHTHIIHECCTEQVVVQLTVQGNTLDFDGALQYLCADTIRFGGLSKI